MDIDEKFALNEQARAEILLPTGRVIYCENCHEPIKDEEANFNWYTTLVNSPIKIQKTYCLDCIPEVIAYRYMMRNVSEMTKELVKAFELDLYHAAADKITPYRRVKHI